MRARGVRGGGGCGGAGWVGGLVCGELDERRGGEGRGGFCEVLAARTALVVRKSEGQAEVLAL